MKRLLFIVFFLIPVFSFSQQAQHYYKIKLLGVKSIAEAKVAAEQMYELFDVMPAFNENTKSFEFTSSVLMDKNKFSAKIKFNGYTVLVFYKEPMPSRTK